MRRLFCSAMPAWLATVSSSRMSLTSKVRTSPSRSATVSVPMTPASPRTGPRSPPATDGRPGGRGPSGPRPTRHQDRSHVDSPGAASTGRPDAAEVLPHQPAARAQPDPHRALAGPKNVISACSLRSSSFASARTLPSVSVTSGVLVTAWLKR